MKLSRLPAMLAFAAMLGTAVPASANEKYAGIVVDANTGRTLYAENADERRFPASLTKMMTLYVLFEELEAKRVSLEDRFSVSANAAGQAPSKIGVKAGSSIKVEDAILALTTKSANDVAVVIAENVGGSVAGFATRMNRTAKSLGMNSSTFRNPHGLPNPDQTSTARDFVKLGTALQDRFPSYYKYFGARSFTYKGVRHRNHNRLLGSVQGVDGIKTGYTRASGFNLVSNVKRDGRHIVAVVMGGKTGASRDAHMRNLIAKYLPAAKRGARSADVVIADMQSSDPTETKVQEGRVEVAAATPPAAVADDVRVPRARPELRSEPALAYAGASRPRDLVAAAMAESAKPPRVKAKPTAQVPPDPIFDRISGATEVAQLAFVSPKKLGGADPIARLTAIAKVRAGNQNGAAVLNAPAANQDIVASVAPAPAGASEASPEAGGWHVQIGAVPTRDGAHALIENAQASIGAALAVVRPLTQEVNKNGTTLYRARFAGLADKESARALCAKLESKSINCLAVPN